MKLKPHLFCIECLTNLHVGSGESNYNIIDNEVERDPVLANVPVIHSSGVKGALRAHCKALNGGTEPQWMKNVFGDEPRSENDTPSGKYKFFTANLLARPLRVSQGKRSYVLATTRKILDNLEHLAQGLGATLSIPSDKTGTIKAEGMNMDWFKPDNTDLFGEEKIALAESFKDIDLPVLARNQLDDKGISKQLWYEEIVPYTSRFTFFVLVPENASDFEVFKNAITGGAVQFGGNASVGYGYCTVKEVK